MQQRRGFTLVELMITITLFLLFLAFTSLNLARPQTQASLSTTVSLLVSDLQNQQLKAMVNDGGTGEAPSAYGLYIETRKYTLFQGSAFSVGQASNFEVAMSPDIELQQVVFPSSSVVFVQRSGEVQNYNPSGNSMVVRSTVSGEQKIISVNKYGVITIQ